MRYLACVLSVMAAPVWADPATVLEVTTTAQSDGWRFDVRLEHPDTGWDHYADGWRIEDARGTVLGERPLAHPHVNEMPFTRSTSGVVIPEEITEVFVRTRCNVDGWHDAVCAVTLGG